MKLKNKIALVMTLLGIGILIFVLLFYHFWSRNIFINEEKESVIHISKAVTQEVDTHFLEIVNTVKTLSSTPIIKEYLGESNSEFKKLTDTDRECYIDDLAVRWKETHNLEDPFLDVYMGNPVSEFLEMQKELIPERYGEIFVTNQYGVMIASTNKLTTINHAHKYWWVAAYNDGNGRVFLDDRGFDTSAEGYVMGIVVPIKENNEIIGILKANVDIFGVLSHIIESFEELYANSRVKIVRTGGLVVLEKDTPPLSTSVCDKMKDHLEQKITAHINTNQEGIERLVGVAEIPVTMGTDRVGFGGSYESIDHIQGNLGESWHAVVSIKEEHILANAISTNRLLLIIGAVFTVVTAMVAMGIGRSITKPIVELSIFSQAVGEGDLSRRIEIKSKDEIGYLAKSFNDMIDKLETTMASRNELLQEIKKRKNAEAKLQKLSITDELTGLKNRRAANEFLHSNIGRVDRYDEKLSLILLDIDHFKMVNDTYGHDSGDRVLVALAEILESDVRNLDMVARIGGEEFLIILPQADKLECSTIAERICEIIRNHSFDGIPKVTVSVGVAEYKAEDTFDSILKRVDDALYVSKNSGRDRVTVL